MQIAEIEHPGISIRADYIALSKTDPVLFITGKNDTQLYSCDLSNVEEQLATSKEEVK